VALKVLFNNQNVIKKQNLEFGAVHKGLETRAI
jgi:hypothetical protein